jgi:hypothetical protein
MIASHLAGHYKHEIANLLTDGRAADNMRYKTLGASRLFKLLFSYQSSIYLDSEVAPQSPTFHTADRWLSVGKKKIPLRFFEDFHKMN